ncbi:helix-hairpin-helix domain-containing protein [Sunxiuqinia sp. sy24]|uniref:helix-hairpin-helix domain-containing protein n=1 Tax=Sunxiuqinia sp. sy24 TaxID=3461495 RepID=UPI0040455FF5
MRFQQIIREYFSFTKNERIGLVILLVLIGLILAANQLIFYFETPGVIDSEKLQKLMVMLDEKRAMEQEQAQGTLFRFDPNAIDSLMLDSLQLPNYVKKNLMRYRSKGGRFYKVADMRKIYGMTDSIFDTIQPYVQIVLQNHEPHRPDVNIKRSNEPFQSVHEQVPLNAELKTIEINTAMADELKQLRGIGKVLSVRIVKYRRLLGGFHSFDQLYEVYGLKPETIENILPYLKLDSEQVGQINVNFADVEDFARHPYISFELAKALVAFRSENGFVTKLQVLREKNVISETDFQKIVPYLKTKN